MKRFALAASAIALSLHVPLALAQDFSSTDTSAAMRLGNDLYTAGDVLDSTQNLNGDLNAAGNAINVTGNVGGDVQAAGSSVNISGSVADDVRVAAGNVLLNGNVRGDVIVFAGNVTIARGATVSGNVLVMGGTLLMEGAVRGNLFVRADQVTIAGAVGSDLDVRAERLTLGSEVAGNAVMVADSITLAQAARVGGDVRYWNEEGQLNATGKVGGAVTFDPDLGRGRMTDDNVPEHALAGIIGAVTIYSLLYAALTIGLFMLATKTFFTESAKRLRAAPGWSLFVGLLYFVAMPGVIVLLGITLIGLPVALAALMFYVMSIVFAKVLASIVLARWTELYFKKKWHPAAVYALALGFYVALKLLSIVPFIGWVLCFVVIVTTYGAFASVKFERFRKIR